MKKKRLIRYLLWTIAIIAVAWAALTLYVEGKGPSKVWDIGSKADAKALIIFDPDPFYNLDEQVCLSLANGLNEFGISSTVATVTRAEKIELNNYSVIVYCANTYNWRPDWAIVDFIENEKSKPEHIAVVTLGAGSTEASQHHLEKIIINSGGDLIGSYSLWLWRPNDESKMKQPNVDVAVEMARTWGKQIAQKIKH